MTIPKQRRCRDLTQALLGTRPMKHNEKFMLAMIWNHLFDRLLEGLLILLFTTASDDLLTVHQILKLSKSTMFFN